jgi:hypothetical protein
MVALSSVLLIVAVPLLAIGPNPAVPTWAAARALVDRADDLIVEQLASSGSSVPPRRTDKWPTRARRKPDREARAAVASSRTLDELARLPQPPTQRTPCADEPTSTPLIYLLRTLLI